jgi:hypothetical protein
MKYFLSCFIFFEAFFCLNIYAQGSDAAKTVIAKDESLMLPALKGTDSELLGLSCGVNFSYLDANNEKRVAFANGRKKTTPEQRYRAEFKIIENDVALGANLSFFGMRLGASKTSSTRYAVLNVYYINKSDFFEPQGVAVVDAPFYVSAIHYGWAVHYLVSGESSSFTIEVANQLQAQLNQGFKVDVKLSELKLTKILESNGLEPNAAGFIADDPSFIKGNFKFDKVPHPIFVEYKAIKNVSANPITWATSKITPGRYQVETVSYSINSGKEGGKGDWDTGLGKMRLPDPQFILSIDGQEIAKISDEKDIALRTDRTVPINSPVFGLVAGSVLRIEIWDDDFGRSDSIGVGALTFEELSKYSPDEEIEISIKRGSIGTFKIKLKPAK